MHVAVSLVHSTTSTVNVGGEPRAFSHINDCLISLYLCMGKCNKFFTFFMVVHNLCANKLHQRFLLFFCATHSRAEDNLKMFRVMAVDVNEIKFHLAYAGMHFLSFGSVFCSFGRDMK